MARPIRRAATLACILIGGAGVAACGGGGSHGDAKDASTASSTTTPKVAPPAPLTGLPDTSGAAHSRGVLSIKVENTPGVRPQAGLDRADVVWDEVVEGEITRLLAMFNSQTPDVVGPVRSVRLTDPLIVWPVGGIFAYSGGAPYAVTAIQQAPVTLIDESNAGAGMFRAPAFKAPHNLFARPAQLWTHAAEPVPPPPLFRYLSKGQAFPGAAVGSVTIGFARGYETTYTWDPTTHAWLRSTAGAPFMATSGNQVAPTNVVVLPVTYQGGVGNIGAQAQLIGAGPADVFSGGHEVVGRWTRADKASPMQLVDAAGSPIALNPGTTWVELPAVSYAITVAPPPVATSSPGG